MFIQPDWWEVDDPAVGTNRYSYSPNDPINLADPGGNAPDYGYGTPDSYYSGRHASGDDSGSRETRQEHYERLLEFTSTDFYNGQSPEERAYSLNAADWAEYLQSGELGSGDFIFDFLGLGATALARNAANLSVKQLDDLAKAAAAAAAASGSKQASRLVVHKHHLFSQQFKGFFKNAGIDIDNYTVALGRTVHLSKVHGRGGGALRGNWNKEWSDFISKNPNANREQIFQQMNKMRRDFHLDDLPITPYR